MIKVMEYMAQGKPIVCFDLAETRYSAQDAALYVSGNDELEFARALMLLMDDRELRTRLGSAGRRRAEAELAWRHFVPRLLTVYNRLSNPVLQQGRASNRGQSELEAANSSGDATDARAERQSPQPVS
jgi:glycosyltransferase involved in cell wall biosynthesis